MDDLQRTSTFLKKENRRLLAENNAVRERSDKLEARLSELEALHTKVYRTLKRLSASMAEKEIRQALYEIGISDTEIDLIKNTESLTIKESDVFNFSKVSSGAESKDSKVKVDDMLSGLDF